MTVEPTGPDFERLLEYIRESRGFDFGGYPIPRVWSLSARISY